MGKIKVHINRPEPDKETIRKHKDFNRFSERYEQYYRQDGIRKMLFGTTRDKRRLVYIVIILLTLLILWLAEEENSKPENQEPPKTEQAE